MERCLFRLSCLFCYYSKPLLSPTRRLKNELLSEKDSLVESEKLKRFEKLDDYKPGAGLGLSICSIIAERLGGSLSIDSCYTTGVRFFFTHPCEIVDEAYNQGTTKTK